MAGIDWTNIGTVASTVALVMGGILWVMTKIFNFGRITQRLDSLEGDMADVKSEINSLRVDINQRIDNLNQRMDKLILTIAETHGKL